jgi:hypothetical protein
MRFAVASIVLALTSSALGAALSPRLLKCICPVDRSGDANGKLIDQNGLMYTCAYQNGACHYDTVSPSSLAGV